MKILNNITLLALLGSFLIGCNSSTKYKALYLYPSNHFQRFETEGKYMAEHLAKFGVDANTVSADDNDATQLEQGLKALDEGVDILIISAVNGNTIAPLLREAKSRGVPVIAYNRLISNVDYDLFFTGHNTDNGRIFCERALIDHPSGNYVILAGDRFDRNGVEQKQAIDSMLKKHVDDGRINIIYETYIENWHKEVAAFELEQVIQSHGKNIDVVIAGSDPMAQGVIGVLKKYGLNGKVFVTGQDAELEAVQSIYAGDQHVTIYHPHKTLGVKAAELVFEILKGKQAKDLANSSTFNGLVQIPTFQVKSIGITKDNIEQELIATGEYNWSQIKK
ncbi:MAG: substrate-binding domain-containing protein [Breznakibacter sp.]